MSTRCTSKGQELRGSRCQETGAKIGKVTLISTDKACLSRSLLAMAAASSPTTSPHPVGPSARHTPALNSGRKHGYEVVHSGSFSMDNEILNMIVLRSPLTLGGLIIFMCM